MPSLLMRYLTEDVHVLEKSSQEGDIPSWVLIFGPGRRNTLPLARFVLVPDLTAIHSRRYNNDMTYTCDRVEYFESVGRHLCYPLEYVEQFSDTHPISVIHKSIASSFVQYIYRILKMFSSDNQKMEVDTPPSSHLTLLSKPARSNASFSSSLVSMKCFHPS
jgi:hypothetical protein